MRELSGKTAVVTGAASGIGLAVAEALARRGCPLALADVDRAGLEAARARLAAAGARVTAHQVDVADRPAMLAFADEVAAEHGGARIVVNNAGVALTAPLAEVDLADVEWLLGVNLWGVIHGCKAFLPQLLAAGEGHIVNLASVFGIIGLPTQSAYAASKFAVRGFSESLRAELAPRGVGVTAVFPGPVATAIVERGRFVEPAGEELRRLSAAWFARNATTPTAAADRILRGIEQNAPRVLITPHAHGVAWCKRLWPAWTDRLFGAVARRSGIV